MKSRSQSGVALVITLIMLAVITIIAIAFLALSQRERASVSQTMIGTEAELMANVAVDRAKAQITADMTAFFSNPTNRYTNFYFGVPRVGYPLPLGPDLMASITSTNYTNAPYQAPATGATRDEDLQSITNLLEDPRVPVFVRTPDSQGNTNRYYLDLNRNDRFEPSGIVPFVEPNGVTNGEHYAIGDPEWIGVLSRINEPHSGANRFIGRYAYLVIPVGRTLDFNFIHNEAKRGASQNGFYRNQGHASWELNLAAFLSDLNTNLWSPTGNQYIYQPVATSTSTGFGFEDSTEILNYRYNGGFNQLNSADDIFGAFGASYANDGIDQYVDEQATALTEDDTGQPWPGSSTANHFFSVHDFFNQKNPDYPNFRDRLRSAGVSLNGSFNRHTFYRMLAQVATDTAPEKMADGRVNINYVNYTTPLGKSRSPSEFIEWGAGEFVELAANGIFRENGFRFDVDTPLTVRNIEIYPTNHYTPAVHRVLQMAVNIYDATRNETKPNVTIYPPFYPTVLQPEFRKVGGKVYISHYRQLDELFDQQTGALVVDAVRDPDKWRDLSDLDDVRNLRTNDFVYGVPILVGAKKGLPNFNEFFFQSQIQFERKLLVEKGANREYLRTNQMFLIGISNSMGLEVWNSYTNTYTYPRDLQLYAAVEMSTSLTNETPFHQTWNDVVVTLTNITADTWRGGQFRFPVANTNGIWTNRVIVPESIYMQNRFFPTNPPRWEPIFPAPQWVLTTTNRLRYFLFDNRRIVDAVGLAPMVVSTNITQALATNYVFGPLWSTNRGGGNSRDVRAPTQGIINQLAVSQGDYVLGLNDNWADFQTYPTTAAEKAAFKAFLRTNGNPTVERRMAPFTPQVKIYWRPEWRANDPLVHYVEEDLRLKRDVDIQFSSVSASTNRASAYLRNNIGKINDPEYQPWGGPPNTDLSDSSKAQRYLDRTITDPLVRRSDDWDFPTNKLASIGELGRVHRGTPWQTIYLKSTPAPANQWAKVHSSARAHPTNDWCVADVFTVAQHPNASKGVLSVNQTNVAAWSALFSGIDLGRVRGARRGSPAIMQPIALGTNVLNLVEAINANRTNFHGKVYSKLAEFLSTAALSSTNSPYARTPYLTAAEEQARDSTWTDADWEGIPRSILSLVKVGEPRFLIYAFGQSLKPAQGSVQTAAGYRGLSVNYEVTGELAARAVVRVDLDWPDPKGADANEPPVPHAVIESFNIIPPD